MPAAAWYVVVARPHSAECGRLPDRWPALPPPARGREAAERAALRWEAETGGWTAARGPAGPGRLRRVRWTEVRGPYATRALARRAMEER